MVKVNSLYWRNVTEEYDGLETYKACSALGWSAVYLEEKEYVAVHAHMEGDLFTFHARNKSRSSTVKEAKQSAQEYHNNLVRSLLDT